MSLDEAFMQQALALARQAAGLGEVPVGAVAVYGDKVIGAGFNRREKDRHPLAHAELFALEAAARELGVWRLTGVTLYVTLEPCAMCAGAIVLARIPRVVFGAWDEKAGAAGSVFDILRERRLNHWVEVYPGVREDECSALLRDFFAAHRK
jgi:tRNA(adenine34) deaminase